MNQTFKIILVGAAGCGKSALVKRVSDDDFSGQYSKTIGVDVAPLRFDTNYGPMVLNVWDCAGDPNFGGLRDGYYVQAQGVIYAFDLTSRRTMEDLPSHIQNVTRMTGAIPSVIIGGKRDLKDREVTSENFATFASSLRKKVGCYEVSAKSMYNFTEPFLYLLRKLTGHEDLVLFC